MTAAPAISNATTGRDLRRAEAAMTAPMMAGASR
jgi:hypothetical protein